MLTTRVDLATEDGEAVCTATSMLVARGMTAVRLTDVAVGTELPELVFRDHPRGPRPLRRRLRRLQPDPLERAGGHLRRPARRDRPRHVHHGAGRPAPSPAGPGIPAALVEYHVRFGRPVVVPDDDEGAEVTVRGKVGALLEDGRARIDLAVTSDGEKVLSLARAIVRLA